MPQIPHIDRGPTRIPQSKEMINSRNFLLFYWVGMAQEGEARPYRPLSNQLHPIHSKPRGRMSTRIRAILFSRPHVMNGNAYEKPRER